MLHPCHSTFCRLDFPFPPELHAAGANSRHDSQAFGLRVKGRVFQEPADEFCGFNVDNVEMNQTVGIVAEPLFEKILVPREQRGAVQAMQQRNHVFIFKSAAGNFFADLPEGDSPLSQESALIVTNVFIEKIHAASAGTRRCLSLPWPLSKAFLESCIVSRTASRLTRPPHALTS